MGRLLPYLGLLLSLAAWAQSQPPSLREVQRALAHPTPAASDTAAWLEAMKYQVGPGPSATYEHGEGPVVVLWMEDGPVARLVLTGMRHLKGRWHGTLVARLGPPGPAPQDPPHLLLRVRSSRSLRAQALAIPRSEFHSQVDLVDIDVPSTPEQDSGVACAEILLALRSDLADPFDDVVLNVEKFQASPHGHITVSLKTYAAGTRRGVLARLQDLMKRTAPQASLKLPADLPPSDAPPDWAWRLRQALGRDLGADRIVLQAPIEEDLRYQDTGAAWSCPVVSLWLPAQDPPADCALAVTLALLEAFKAGS